MGARIGINTWNWVSPFKTADAASLFPKIRQMGFALVEVALEDPALVEGPAVREQLESNELGVTVCGAFGPSRDLSSEDPAVIRQALEYIEASLAFCEQVGAAVFAGPIYAAVGKARQLPPEARKREFDRSVEGVRKAAAIASDHGVTLGIEPLNRFETDMVNTASQALAMVQAVGCANVGIHLDTFHMNIEEESVYDAALLAGSHLVHVHASESHRGTPGKGLAAWEQLGHALREIRYTGPVVIETFTPEVKEIARAAAIWRPLAPSQDYLAEEGLRFLRALL